MGSLLYAEDVVLVADLVENLQGMIDVVDRFCRRWRMEINLKKSEVMVVRARPWRCARSSHSHKEAKRGGAFCSPEKECVLCSPWVCRGRRLKVVGRYKYLGIWFTSDLLWDVHINAMVSKAKERTRTLHRTLGNGRLPARAKTIVWLASVRPLLEYGCEVWTANSTQAKRLEAV